MKKTLLLMTLVALILTVSVSLFAQKHGRGMGPGKGMNCEMNGPEMFGPEMFKELKLTADQIKKIDEIRDNHRKEMIQLNADLEKKRIDEKNAVINEKYADAKKISKEINALHGTISEKRIDLIENIGKQLTAEQKEVLKAKRMERPGMHKGMHQGMQDEKPGKGKGQRMMQEDCNNCDK